MNVLLILTIIFSSVLAFKDFPFGGKIIDGVIIKITEAPWVTAIYKARKQNDGKWLLQYGCGGTIIGRNEIITAAHCIPKNISRGILMHFIAGSTNREKGSVHKLDYVRYHPLENPKDLNDLSYEIAFVRVKEPFMFSTNLRPISVRNSEPKSGSVVMLAGWGTTKPEHDPSHVRPKELRAVNLTMWDKDDCYSNFNISLSFSRYPEVLRCMKNIGESSSKSGCRGDSGSGVVYRNKLVGVLSGGVASGPIPSSETPCNAPNLVNVYNSAVKVKRWIGKMIRESRLGRG